jgi:cyclopropane fatty-acyl-phospholipid synthase-like methyltransferase
MIRDGGWRNYCIWEHSATVRELYARRCRLEEQEMTCAAQAAELLAPHVRPGDTVLDVGCGSGYFYHSLRRRGIPAVYFGIDAAPSLIAIGHAHLPAHGLSPDHLRVLRLEDLDGEADHVVCLNVLSNLDNYHRPLERILQCTRKTVVLRESCKQGASYAYVRDDYLDPGCDLKVHVNTYDLEEFQRFIEGYGFRVRRVPDRRTGDGPEMVIGHPHYWKFFAAERVACQ